MLPIAATFFHRMVYVHSSFLILSCCPVQLFILPVHWMYACEGLQWHPTPHIIRSIPVFMESALSVTFPIVDHFSSKTCCSLCIWHTNFSWFSLHRTDHSFADSPLLILLIFPILIAYSPSSLGLFSYWLTIYVWRVQKLWKIQFHT